MEHPIQPFEVEWVHHAEVPANSVSAASRHIDGLETVSISGRNAIVAALARRFESVMVRCRRINRSVAEWQSLPNPRRMSRVRRHVWRSAEDLLADLVTFRQVDLQCGGHRLRCPDVAPEYSPIDGIHRVPATLHVSRTLADLPVWLTVERWWNDHCMVGLALRRTGRLHYSRRYFTAAHDALARLDRQLQPIG